MTLYTAVRTLTNKGFTFVKRYPTYEVWEKNNTTILIPCLEKMPKYVERIIKYV
jgi:hypothetical protein